jgi:hypothetical protein
MNEESNYPENMTPEELEFWKKVIIAGNARSVGPVWESLLSDAKIAVESLRKATRAQCLSRNRSDLDKEAEETRYFIDHW